MNGEESSTFTSSIMNHNSAYSLRLYACTHTRSRMTSTSFSSSRFSTTCALPSMKSADSTTSRGWPPSHGFMSSSDTSTSLYSSARSSSSDEDSEESMPPSRSISMRAILRNSTVFSVRCFLNRR